MDTITISLDLFERLVIGAENLSKGYRLNNQQRAAWRAIAEEATAAQQGLQSDVCHVAVKGTHSWYTSGNGMVCEHCGTRR